VILPFKIKFGKTMQITLHPKLKKIAEKISKDEGLYLIYFGCLTVFSDLTKKIFPEKD